MTPKGTHDPLSEDELLLAVTLVEDAMQGKKSLVLTDPARVRSYR